MPSKLIESLRSDLAELRKAGSISKVTMRQFDAMTDASEYEGRLETAHLLRSPRNAARLALALEQAQLGEGLELSVEELGREVLGGPSGE